MDEPQDAQELEHVDQPQPEQEDAGVEEAQEVLPVSKQMPKPRIDEDLQEKNWRAAREQIRFLKEQTEYWQKLAMQKEQPKQVEEEGSDDDLIDNRRFKKGLQSYHEKTQSELAQLKQDLAEAKIRAKYSDFDEVCSQDNINWLKENEPELAETLGMLANDPSKQYATAYKLLSKTDYYMNKKRGVDTESVKLQASKNASKPLPSVAARKQGALGDAQKFADGKLTPEMAKQLREEMFRCARQS